jgi:hypothetical protein
MDYRVNERNRRTTLANSEVKVTPRGFEPLFKSSGNMNIPHFGSAKSGAYLSDFTSENAASPPCETPAPTDPDLSALVSAWSKLPSALKAGIVAMVRAASDSM